LGKEFAMAIKENKGNLDLIKELVNLVKENNLAEIEFEQNYKIEDSIHVKVIAKNDSYYQSPNFIPMDVEQTVVVSEKSKQKKESSVDTNDPSNHPGVLLSPMVGTIYLSPEPGADLFVKIGDTVIAGQTILIVEAMKTLNQIPAINSGVVKRIFVEDGSPVEFGSPLVIIE
jgi:acetyl-CoA carboxylase biotin carboxyl carrier protein